MLQIDVKNIINPDKAFFPDLSTEGALELGNESNLSGKKILMCFSHRAECFGAAVVPP